LHITPFAEKINRGQNGNINNLARRLTEEEYMENQRVSEKRQCEPLIEQFSHIFSVEPGRIHEFQCQIKVLEGDPIHQRPYPIPMSKMARMDSEIQRMLAINIIEPST